MILLNDQIWQDFLKIVRDEVGSRVVETWIKAVTISRYDHSTGGIYLSTPNLFVKNWVESNYKDLFAKHLKRLLGVDHVTIYFLLASSSSAEQKSTEQKGLQAASDVDESFKTILPAVSAAVKKKKYEVLKKNLGYQPNLSKLNPIYTFDSFVVGENNQFAYASAMAVAEKPGQLYNPLLLYGGSGLGKTHLLHAIGNTISQKNPSLVVLYQSTDRFITEFINASRFDGIAKFQAKYREVDVLLVDNIQFLVNKEQTQEIFFHIFNSLYESNKQIVLSCDMLPRYLGGLVDRLKSRLEWGLVADVQVPTLETKISILMRKAQAQDVLVGADVAYFIAQQPVSNVRELEGSLIRVIAYASLTSQEISVELAKKVLGIHSEVKLASRQIDFKFIVNIVKKHFSYDIDQLRSKDRSKGVSHARQVAMYLMKTNTDKSLREIGLYLERKDHSTVSHALQRITDLKLNHEKFSAQLKKIEEELL